MVAPLASMLVAAPAWALRDDGVRPGQGSFDARIEATAGFVAELIPAQQRAADALRAAIPGLTIRYDERHGVARSLSNPVGYLTAPRPGFDARRDARDAARAFVTDHADVLGLLPADLAEITVTDEVFNRASGSSVVYLGQRYRAIPVYNGQLQVGVNRDGRIINVNNAFVGRLAAAAGSAEPRLDAAAAVAAAAAHLGIGPGAAPRVEQREGGAQQITRLRHDALSSHAIVARLVWLPIRAGDVRLAWNFQLALPDGAHHYDITVDARSGTLWTRFDWVQAAAPLTPSLR